MKTGLKRVYFLTGMALNLGMNGCGSHSAQNPKEEAPVIQTQAAVTTVSPSDGITVEKLPCPAVPIDLAAHPSFSIQGFVIASERYTNTNDHPVKITPSDSAASLSLKTQVLSQPGAASTTMTGLVLSATTPRSQFDIEEASNSILGRAIDIGPGQKIVINWRISTPPGLRVCDLHLGKNMWSHMEVDYSADGTALQGSFQRAVDFSDDSNGRSGELFSETFQADQTTGVVNSSLLWGDQNCVWVDFVNSAPEDYDLGRKG
jgi:hypothetical protein